MTLNKTWIESSVKKYDENNTKEYALEKQIFESIKECGSPPSYLTKDILMMIEEWKWGRKRGLVKENDEQFVRGVTQVSFATNNERLKLEVLTLLRGVYIRMASAILFFCYPKRYTIMDGRAWESLKALGKIDGEIEDTFECWQKYNKRCQDIAKQFDISLRELDKALWYKGDK